MLVRKHSAMPTVSPQMPPSSDALVHTMAAECKWTMCLDSRSSQKQRCLTASSAEASAAASPHSEASCATSGASGFSAVDTRSRKGARRSAAPKSEPRLQHSKRLMWVQAYAPERAHATAEAAVQR